MPLTFKFILSSSLYLIFICSAISQKNDSSNYNDCSNAFELCVIKDYHFYPDHGIGESDNLFLKDSKVHETNPIWIKIPIKSAGNLEFVIIPDSPKDDIDFILYKSDNKNNCNILNPIRTMTSGETIGHNNFNCLGNTGIITGKNDKSEDIGCNSHKDKFLSSPLLESEQTYYLLINNYDSQNGFTIKFDPANTYKLKNPCIKNEEPIEFKLYPNPTSDILNIVPQSFVKNETRIEIIDILGRIYKNKLIKDFNEPFIIETTFLDSGKYLVRITNGSDVRIKSFIQE